MRFYLKLKHEQVRVYRENHEEIVCKYLLLVLLSLFVICEFQEIYAIMTGTRIVTVVLAEGQAQASTETKAAVVLSPIGSSDIESEQAGESQDSTSQPNIIELIRRTFPEAPECAVSIAKAESGLRPDAVHKNSNGSVDCGIMQINSVHGYDCEWLKDPVNNLKAARAVYEKQGFEAWSTYNWGKQHNQAI